LKNTVPHGVLENQENAVLDGVPNNPTRAEGTMTITAEDVILEIERAFDGVAREDGITLHEAVALDDYASDAGRTQARLRDTESRWQDVPTEDIEREYTIFSFLDDKGFKYYLPAYMTWMLRNFDHTHSASLDSTIYSLEPSSYFSKRSTLFNLAQSTAILHFLEFFMTDERFDDHSTLNAWTHWAQICEEFTSRKETT
jgi:hypothetical protein